MNRCCVCGKPCETGGTALADGVICGSCARDAGLDTIAFDEEHPLAAQNEATVAGFVRLQKELRRRFRPAQTYGELELDPEGQIFRVKGVCFGYSALESYEADGDVRIGLDGELKTGKGAGAVFWGGAIGSPLGPVGTAVGAAVGLAVKAAVGNRIRQMDLVLHLRDPLVRHIRLAFVEEKIRTSSDEFKEKFSAAAETVKGLEIIHRVNHPEEAEKEEEPETETAAEEAAPEAPAVKPDEAAERAKDPKPYKGDRPFVFISYAHRDKDRVYPILQELIRLGLRLWFDEAIVPSTEWDEDIAEHIVACEGMISFLSDNYAASQNCRDELKYARRYNKPQLLIYLEKTTLSKGIEMRLSTIQAIKPDLNSPETVKQFYEKILECPFVAENLRKTEAEDGK